MGVVVRIFFQDAWANGVPALGRAGLLLSLPWIKKIKFFPCMSSVLRYIGIDKSIGALGKDSVKGPFLPTFLVVSPLFR